MPPVRWPAVTRAGKGRQPVLRLGGQVILAVRLAEALGREGGPAPPETTPVLILELGDRRIALIVDELIQAREVVVKLGNRGPGYRARWGRLSAAMAASC